MFFLASDLHGRRGHYRALLRAVERGRPQAVLLAGDLLPPLMASNPVEFVEDFLARGIRWLRRRMGDAAPRVVLVPGNDDVRLAEEALQSHEDLWTWAHRRRVEVAGVQVYGYGCVPPTPFRLKDYERYDVSRYLDPGCLAPEDGLVTAPVPDWERRFRTIAEDLEELVGEDDLSEALLLFHCPPHGTALDRADLEGVTVDHVPVDPHVGSLAIRRLIEERQPRAGLFGHVHEAPRWRERLGRTVLLSAAHDGPELALVRFDPTDPRRAARRLVASGIERTFLH